MLSDPCLWQRWAHALYKAGVPLLPRLITKMIHLVLSSIVPHTAEIGRGTKLGHSGLGVVIHGRAKIGERVEILQNVTIGGNSREAGEPVIEDDAYIGAGARVLGPITVGRGSIIAANAVVTHDVPPHCVVGGVPAKILKENIDAKEFLYHRRNDPLYKHRTDKDVQ